MCFQTFFKIFYQVLIHNILQIFCNHILMILVQLFHTKEQGINSYIFPIQFIKNIMCQI